MNSRFAVPLLAGLIACVDLSEQPLDGPYCVAQDPTGSFKTLYYKAGELQYERIRNVQQAGYAARFIFAESEGRYYYINRAQDRASDLGDPLVQKAISRPLTKAGFDALLDSLELNDFRF